MDTVFLSGLGQTPGVWDGVRRCLPELKDVRCPSLSGGTYPALYDALEADCQALEAPFRLCGLSLGAVLALDYAARNPHHVASLVLIAPRYRMPRRLLEIQDRIFALLPDAAWEIVPGAGHVVTRDAPAALAARLREFWTEK